VNETMVDWSKIRNQCGNQITNTANEAYCKSNEWV